MRLPFLLCLIYCLSVSPVTLTAQIPSPSPLGEISQVVGDVTITISYERPSARGRKIFGGLVPWHRVWRTGAGYCTKLGFDRAVTVGRQPVPAGRYSLLTIPGPEEWTVILNADTTLYGARDYDPDRDVVRFRVPARKAGRHYEALTIDVDIIPDDARLYLSWADVSIDFPVETGTEDRVLAYVDGLLTAPPNDTVSYAWPAEYLLLRRQSFQKALALADRQLAVAPGEYPYRVKMEIYAHLGYYDRAIREAERARAYVKAHPMDERNQAWSLNFWKEQLDKLRKEKDAR